MRMELETVVPFKRFTLVPFSFVTGVPQLATAGPLQPDGGVVGEVNVRSRDTRVGRNVTLYSGTGQIIIQVRLEQAHISLLVIGHQHQFVYIISP